MPESASAAVGDRVLPGPGLLLTRGLLYLILLLLVAMVGWSAFARVDVIVNADGRLLSAHGPIRLSVAQAGILVEVLTEVGAHVKAGDPLLRLDAFREEA